MPSDTYSNLVRDDLDICRQILRQKLIKILDEALSPHASEPTRIKAINQLQNAICTGRLKEEREGF